MRTAKTLIRLGRCPGWYESSLGAHSILLVLSWSGSVLLIMCNVSLCLTDFLLRSTNLIKSPVSFPIISIVKLKKKKKKKKKYESMTLGKFNIYRNTLTLELCEITPKMPLLLYGEVLNFGAQVKPRLKAVNAFLFYTFIPLVSYS